MNIKKILIAVSTLAFLKSYSYGVSPEIAVVVNENSAVSKLTVTEARDIYNGTKTFWGKVRIKPFDQHDNQPIRKEFLKRALKIDSKTYEMYWLKKVFQGEGIPPTVKKTSKDVLEAVAEDDGAVGYIWASEVSGSRGVKVVLTIKE